MENVGWEVRQLTLNDFTFMLKGLQWTIGISAIAISLGLVLWWESFGRSAGQATCWPKTLNLSIGLYPPCRWCMQR